jgi:hypothetical protein
MKVVQRRVKAGSVVEQKEEVRRKRDSDGSDQRRLHFLFRHQ